VIWDPRHKRAVGSIRETEAPAGEAWGKLDGTFTTEADGWLTLYLYNHGDTGIVHYGQPHLRPADE
jgi:hypothetical protein